MLVTCICRFRFTPYLGSKENAGGKVAAKSRPDEVAYSLANYKPSKIQGVSKVSIHFKI